MKQSSLLSCEVRSSFYVHGESNEEKGFIPLTTGHQLRRRRLQSGVADADGDPQSAGRGGAASAAQALPLQPKAKRNNINIATRNCAIKLFYLFFN
jgi:hypothetical protein